MTDNRWKMGWSGIALVIVSWTILAALTVARLDGGGNADPFIAGMFVVTAFMGTLVNDA